MKRLALLLVAVCIACKPARQQQPANPAAGPQVRATVVTIRTTVEPEKKTYDHAIIIAGDRARSTGENDLWRLFDLQAKTVTFVDDVAKTIRTEPLADILRRRRAALDDALPAHYPRATLSRPNERRTLHGVDARQLAIASGAYRRVLWMGEHPAIPRDLFAMMHASDPPASPLAPMMRAVDAALVAERGFPLADRTEVPVGDGKLIVERTVTSIVQRSMPESALALPRDYKDITPRSAAEKKK